MEESILFFLPLRIETCSRSLFRGDSVRQSSRPIGDYMVQIGPIGKNNPWWNARIRHVVLIYHAGILLSHPGVGNLYPPKPPCCAWVNVIPHPELLSYDNNNHNNNTGQQTICVYTMSRTTDNANFFLKTIQHLVQYVPIGWASNETLTFYFRFQTTNIIMVYLEHTTTCHIPTGK